MKQIIYKKTHQIKFYTINIYPKDFLLLCNFAYSIYALTNVIARLIVALFQIESREFPLLWLQFKKYLMA